MWWTGYYFTKNQPKIRKYQKTTAKKIIALSKQLILLPFEVCDDGGDAKYLNDETNCK